VAPVPVAALWCAVLLGAQLLRARAYGRKPLFAPAAGSAGAGVRYAFTGALLPRAKESVRRNPATYAAGVLLHAGLAAAFLLLFTPVRVLAAPALAGACAGAALLVKRALTPHLRGLSSADDFLANGLATGFAAVAGLSVLVPGTAPLLPWAGAALLFYVPLGKLRHCVFFFLSRWHLGAFFGRRGTFPTAQEP